MATVGDKIDIGQLTMPVLRNQMTPLIIDSRVVLFRNILTPGHSVRIRVRVRESIYFGGSKYFVTPALDEMWSHRLAPVMRRAAAFWTDCNI